MTSVRLKESPSRLHYVLAVGFALAGFSILAMEAESSVPGLGGLMLHLNVIAETSVDASPDAPPFQISVSFDGYDPNATSLVLADDGPYDAPYETLMDRAYNAQYGWLATGRWGVPASYTLYVEQLDATDGLEVYEGGLGADVGGQGVVFGPPHALTPIFGTEGTASRWAWGTRETGLRMTHHWYATDTPGPHAATYRLYFEHNDTGLLHPDYEPGEITLLWQNPLTELAGDFNASGSVEQGDLNLVLNNWGVDASGLAPPGWLAQRPNGTIDQDELNAVLNNWGNPAPRSLSNAPIPEPIMGWVLLPAGAWIRRRADA